ncbi:hypothetical protein LC605_02935 [Nostoc sp. CHAB 5836]|nr:hypothetical protein [Nostoc sp. CHAB 5836]
MTNDSLGQLALFASLYLLFVENIGTTQSNTAVHRHYPTHNRFTLALKINGSNAPCQESISPDAKAPV